MTLRNILGTIAATALIVLSVLVTMAPSVSANPLSFIRKQSAAATTTIAYMTPGTATTTLVLDASAGNAFASNNVAALLVQMTASSTASELRWRYEYSQDAVCGTTNGNADWYAGDSSFADNLTSTSSPARISALPFEFSWTYASTTPGGAVVGANTDLGKKLISVPILTRCARVVFYVPAGSTNAGVWAEWVAKKE